MLFVGDSDALVILQRLLTATCKPYFEMLESWLCRGILKDPYAEFMVKEDKVSFFALDSISKPDALWEA